MENEVIGKNPLAEPIRSIGESVSSIKWEKPFIAPVINFVVLIFIGIIFCFLYISIGVIAQIVYLLECYKRDYYNKIKSNSISSIEKSSYFVAVGVFTIIWLPFKLFLIPFSIIGIFLNRNSKFKVTVILIFVFLSILTLILIGNRNPQSFSYFIERFDFLLRNNSSNISTTQNSSFQAEYLLKNKDEDFSFPDFDALNEPYLSKTLVTPTYLDSSFLVEDQYFLNIASWKVNYFTDDLSNVFFSSLEKMLSEHDLIGLHDVPTSINIDDFFSDL